MTLQERESPEGREASPLSLNSELSPRPKSAITTREIKFTTSLTNDEFIPMVEFKGTRSIENSYADSVRRGSLPMRPKTTSTIRTSSSLNSLALLVEGRGGDTDISQTPDSRSPTSPLTDVENPEVYYTVNRRPSTKSAISKDR